VSLNVKGQVETYNKITFNNEQYSAFAVKLDSNTIGQFKRLPNTNQLSYFDFISKQLKVDSNIYLINSSIVSDLVKCTTEGLLIDEFSVKKNLNNQNGNGNFYLKPNACLLFTRNDADLTSTDATVVDTSIRLGIQSGPMLINQSLICSSFNPNSVNRNMRSGVGIYTTPTNQKYIVFAVSETPVSFFELAEFFHYKFNCSSALSLESVNCAIYFPSYDFQSVQGKVICNYIGFKYN
jgi:uncharacterized protein YigE (DUF2233 family)